MKLKYIISFGIVCLLSLMGVFISLQTDAQELNRDFNIETLYGNEDILDELEISAVIREGRKDFSKVTFTSNGAEIEPTIYDEHHGLGERELENRELYRGAAWVSKLETDDFIITHNFDHMYIWNSSSDPSARLAVLNKETGKIEALTHVFDEVLPHMQVWSSSAFLIESNGVFRYVLVTENNEFLVYLFDPAAMTLTFEFSDTIETSGNGWVSWGATDHGILMMEQDDNGNNTGFYTLDFETREFKAISLEKIDFEISLWNMWSTGSKILFEDWETNGINILDIETGEATQLEAPSFATELTNDMWATHSVVGNNKYFVLNFNVESMTPQTQFIAIYDLESLEKVYEGSIRLRRDQGLLEIWGTIQGFSVNTID